MKKKYVYRAALHNLGCKVNAYELEAARELLEAAGYEIVPFEPGADLYVINTCTVTNIADRKSRQMLHRARKMNPDAIVVAMGCYAQIRGEELEKDEAIDIVIGNNRRGELLSVITRQMESGRKQTERIELSTDRTYEDLSIRRTPDHTRAFIKVQEGCDRFCSYCIIPFARGRSRSRRPEDVCEEVRHLAEQGTKEVVITGIQVCAYGADLRKEGGSTDDHTGNVSARREAEPGTYDLLRLLRDIAEISGIERIRLGSLDPAFLTPERIRALAEIPKICPHFHLSLQSGCSRTLKRMNRPYTAEMFTEVCAGLREAFDDPALAADVIVGFPGETEPDFEESADLIRKVHFFETHIFPFSRREGTRAAGMSGQIPESVKRERAEVLRAVCDENRAAFLRRAEGKTVSVLLEEPVTENGKKWWTGHTPRYCNVRIPFSSALKSGDIVRVHISSCGAEYLFGEYEEDI